MNANELLLKLLTEQAKDYLKKLYGENSAAIKFQVERYQSLVRRFANEFPEFDDLSLFTTPGRTEVGGNHTDHNAGRGSGGCS